MLLFQNVLARKLKCDCIMHINYIAQRTKKWMMHYSGCI